jgi:hypothetical protein
MGTQGDAFKGASRTNSMFTDRVAQLEFRVWTLSAIVCSTKVIWCVCFAAMDLQNPVTWCGAARGTGPRRQCMQHQVPWYASSMAVDTRSTPT